MGAGNQQERLDANWIVGFVDGEGCFHIGLNRQPRMMLGWQVLPEFRVVQHRRDVGILTRMRSFFGFGTVCVNNGDRMEFRVRGMDNLVKLIRFFESNPLCTIKNEDRKKFAQVVRMMENDEHLTNTGLVEIAKIALDMNRKRNSSASRILRDYAPDAN